MLGVELERPVDILQVPAHVAHHHVSSGELRGGVPRFEKPSGHEVGPFGSEGLQCKRRARAAGVGTRLGAHDSRIRPSWTYNPLSLEDCLRWIAGGRLAYRVKNAGHPTSHEVGRKDQDEREGRRRHVRAAANREVRDDRCNEIEREAGVGPLA